MRTILRDLRFALRRLRKRPLFTAIAVVSLALGIGANTAIFSLVEAALLRDPAVERPEELVEIYGQQSDVPYLPFSYPDVEDYRDAMGELYRGFAASRFSMASREVGGSVETVTVELVSGGYFPTLGLRPALGRLLGPEDDVARGGHPVVVLSWDFWQRAFGGEPGVLDQTIRLNGTTYRVVGVAPRDYRGFVRGVPPTLYAPMAMMNQLGMVSEDDFVERGNQSIFLRARLRPGVSLAQAEAATAAFARDMIERHPDQWADSRRMFVVRLTEVMVNPIVDPTLRAASLLLFGVVGLVLLVACANLASFLLAQARDRRREIAIRLSLGADRKSLLRQLLTESVALALVGGALGLALAWTAVHALLGVELPLPLPVGLDMRLNAAVLGFTLAASAVAGVLFGLAPALQATRPDVVEVIKGENTGGPPSRFAFRRVLVVAQVAFCVLLLVTSALLLRSMVARGEVDPGFGADPTAMLLVVLPRERTPEQADVFLRELRQRTLAEPGVVAFGAATNILLDPINSSSMSVMVDGVEPPPGDRSFLLPQSFVDHGYFDAAGIPILRGRAFSETEAADGERVAVISQAMAERFWPGEDAVGRTFRNGDTPYRVIGVAADAKVESLGEPPTPFVWRSLAQTTGSSWYILARTRGDDQTLVSRMVAMVRERQPDAVIVYAKTLEQHLAMSLLPARLGALAVSGFALLALTLAIIGVYGVVSYAVARRLREVAVRLSIGANPGDVVRMLTGDGLRLVGLGVAVGTVLALAGASALRGLLYGVAPLDPLSFLAAALAMLAVGALAAWLPARRASRVDPATVLRTE